MSLTRSPTMYESRLLFILATLVVVMVTEIPHVTCQHRRCPNKPSVHPDKDLRFISRIPYNAYACPQGAVSLPCCMEGFSKVQWYEFVKEINSWEPFVNSTTRFPDPDDFDQTLRFDGVVDLDVTNFSCVGYGRDGQTIHHNFTLKTLNCAKQGPSVMLRPYEKHIELPVILNEPFQYACLARFDEHACTGLSMCDLSWFKYNGITLELIHEVGDGMNASNEMVHYSTIKQDNYFIEATLAFNTVRYDDLSWTYYCKGSGEFLKHENNRTLTLRKKLEPLDRQILIGAGSVLVICFVVAIFGYKYRVDAVLVYKTKIRKRRILTHDNANDIFILYNMECEEDREFVRGQLHNNTNPLLFSAYRVDTVDNINFGQSIFEGISSAVENSSIMMVVVSPALLSSEECKMTILHAINTSVRTIYVIREPLANDVDDNASHIQKAINVGFKVKYGERRSLTLCKSGAGDQEFWRLKLDLQVLNMLEQCPVKDDKQLSMDSTTPILA